MDSKSIFLAVVSLLAGLRIASISGRGQSVEALGQSSRLTGVTISEVMFHPAPRTDGRHLEFIELYNSGAIAENLSGYQLSGVVEYTFPSGTIIPAQGFLVVARNPSDIGVAYGLTGVLGPFANSGTLPNDAGTILLRHRTGAVFLQVSYRNRAPWPVAADGTGHSLVLVRPSFGERDSRAWAASADLGGSPGRRDPERTEPWRSVVINEFLAHTDDPDRDYVELYNHSNAPVDLSGWTLSDDPSTNRFRIPSGTSLPARGFAFFTQDQLGFALSSEGEGIFLRDAAQRRVIDAVAFGGQERGVATGRCPDGAEDFSRLASQTPGAPNSGARTAAVVINEILYRPISGDDNDQFVELHNPSNTAVPLGGWRLEGGIAFTFPAESQIDANGFVVVARNREQLLTNHPGLALNATYGDFAGRLSGRGERLALTMPDQVVQTNQSGTLLTNTIQIVVDELTYADGGRWGTWSNGGGSSLEKVDPRADGRLGASWADSDETRKAGWTTISVTGRLDNGNVAADQLQVLLQGAGECLIDEVEVADSTGANRVANSTFETNANGWTAEGTKAQSSWETAEGFNSARSYHVRAVDRGDNQLNRIRVPLTTPLAAGSTATLRAKVRWLKGQPAILLRLRGNWLEAAGAMQLPADLGTPGARNSRWAPNAPPVIHAVAHSPLVPAAGTAVVVTARASDPDGISSVQLRYRVDPGATYTTVEMRDTGSGGDAVAGDGVYSASISAQPAGALVAFYVQAVDRAGGGSGVYPDGAPSREGLVRFGEATPSGTLPVYRIWMTQSALNTWSSRSKLNNTPLPVTFILGTERVIYDARALYAGSPYIAPGYDTPTGRRCGYSLMFPADDRFLGDTDLVLDWPGGHGGERTALQEQMAYWMADQMGLPYSYRYWIRLHVNGVTDLQRTTVFEAVNQPAGDFLRAWQPDESDGDFYKIDRAFEFSDSGSLTADPQPRLENYTTTGGAKKTERYRWTWLKRSTDSVNDYSNIFALVDALNATRPEPYTSQTEALVDLEEWMGILALEHIIVNFDAYGHEIGKNMYAYKPADGKWQLYLFDLDWLMLAAANRRADYSASSAPLFNSEDPTMTRMYGHPPFRRAYFRAIKKAVDGPLLSANCNPVMDAKYQALVNNGITFCDGQALSDPSAVKTWFAQRRTALVNQLNSVATALAVTSHGGVDFSTNVSVITLTGTAPMEVVGLRVNGIVYPVAWTSVNEWAVSLGLQPGTNTCLVEGIGADGQVLAGLANRISVVSPSVPESPEGQVIINEIMAHPARSGGEFVELFNRSTTAAFDLSGWRLHGVDFTFPAGSILAPSSYLVITKDRTVFTALYGNSVPIAGEFVGKLDPEGEQLVLLAPNKSAVRSVIDVVDYRSGAPWPEPPPGVSLQLIDPDQDNYRVANWGVAASELDSAPSAPRWQFVTVTGTATTSRLYLYMESAGEVHLDDLQLVAGEVAGAGPNQIGNGDFETPFPGPWTVSTVLADSALSTSVKHSGQASLHLQSSARGTSQSTAVWQDVGPLVTNATYTLSYWYLPSTNGSGLTMRLSGSGISVTHAVAPAETAALRSTPGSANRLAPLPAKLPGLWINELSFHAAAGWTGSAGEAEPWVELYNAESEPIRLDGWTLTNDRTNLTKWAFPEGTSIAPSGFLLVWLDGESGQGGRSELHSSFRLAPSDGYLALVFPWDGRPAVLDYVEAADPGPGRSFGLYPNGVGGTRVISALATPGASNQSASAAPRLVINEWMAANATSIPDPADGRFDDWFELYNPGDQAVDLSGYLLSDRPDNPAGAWQIPLGTILPPRGFLLVWADDQVQQNQPGAGSLHAGFRLERSGESIALFTPEGERIDAIAFGMQAEDISEGRWPDGGSKIGPLSRPTPGAVNALPLGSAEEIRLIEAFRSSSGELIFSWQAGKNGPCLLQATDQIFPAAWVTVGEIPVEAGTGSVKLPPSGAQRFYRIVWPE